LSGKVFPQVSYFQQVHGEDLTKYKNYHCMRIKNVGLSRVAVAAANLKQKGIKGYKRSHR
jgi:hypothetical protein